MIKLKGQIHIPKIRGTIYRIAGEGSGGPLQAKTVYPSHDEQIIAPDEDFYGLVSVTVKPVPRVRMVETSVESDGETVAKVGMDMQMDTDITARTYPQYYLFNGVRLPEFPFGVIDQYPYAWIRNNTTTGYYDLFFSPVPFYTVDSDSISGSGTTKPFYRVAIATAETATEWEDNGTSDKNLTYDSARTVLWSNHDIPNGSATATDIYFEGTEPVPVD